MKVRLKCVGLVRGGATFQLRESSFGLAEFTLSGTAIVGRDYDAVILEAKEQAAVVGEAKGKKPEDPSPASVVIPGEGPAFKPFREPKAKADERSEKDEPKDEPAEQKTKKK